MASVNLHTVLQAMEQEGLLKKYYQHRDFGLYRVADWSYMAIATTTKDVYDEDGEMITERYFFAFHLDAEYTRRLLENGSYFMAAVLSDSVEKKEDLTLKGTEMLHQLRKIREEVRSGLRQPMLDPAVERQLKIAHKNSLAPLVKKFGDPPAMSEKSMATTMALCLLYPLGLPWFYLGRIKTGIAMIAGLFAGAFFGPAIFVAMAVEVAYLFYFFFRLICGSEKDGKGLLVLSKKSKAHVRASIEEYNRYLAEGL